MKKTNPYVCPKCGEDIDLETIEFNCSDDDSLASAKRYCPKCGEVWREYFKLVYDGYSCDGKYYFANGEEIGANNH